MALATHWQLAGVSDRLVSWIPGWEVAEGVGWCEHRFSFEHEGLWHGGAAGRGHGGAA